MCQVALNIYHPGKKVFDLVFTTLEIKVLYFSMEYPEGLVLLISWT